MEQIPESAPGASNAQAGARVLLVDDNTKLCRLVKDYLEPLGYQIFFAHTGPDGLAKALEGGFQAIILDVMLPGMDGFEVLKRLRVHSTVPVLMLTGRGDASDRIAGLDWGADDYVPKTFSTRELLSRLRAVIRRSLVTAAQRRATPQPVIPIADLLVDPNTRSATLAGTLLPLTPSEFDLLLCLARACGSVKSREELLLEVAERDFEAFDRSVDVHISSLRRKLGDDPKNPRFIQTVRATGYLLRRPETGSLP